MSTPTSVVLPPPVAKPKRSAKQSPRQRKTSPAPATRATVYAPFAVVDDFLEYYNPPPSDLPYEDGEPMESNWHRAQGNLLVEVTYQSRPGQNDFYAGANMFVYYNSEQANEAKQTGGKSKYRGPDFFVVLNVDGSYDRHSWRVWDEQGHYPDVIVELLSESTAETDKNEKRTLYAKTFRTPNYFYFDPTTNVLTAFQLIGSEYQPLIANDKGWFWCNALGLWLGTWQGEYLGHEHTWLRFFTPEGQLVPTGAEAGQQRAAMADLRAEAERQRAEAERQRAEAERQRAEAERQRAENAEAQLTLLRAKLQELGINNLS